MHRTIASLVLGFMLLLVAGSVEVSGQVPCSFIGGFTALRELVGPQAVGGCVEEEHLNPANGYIEQRTTGGLLARPNESTVAAFTDGVTTWISGPDGLQTRLSGDRFVWESELAAPIPTLPAGVGNASLTSSDVLPILTAASPSPSPSPPAVASPDAGLAPAALTAPAAVATPTTAPTPTPAVRVKLREKPDSVDTGTDARFEVETNARKGNCTLVVAYHDKPDVGVAIGEIDNSRCEMKYTVPQDAKTGKATAKITITSTEGTATTDDDFEVRKGDSLLGGDIDIELEGDDLPDEVDVGDTVKFTVKTSLKEKGKCEMTIAWPRYTGYTGDSQEPGDDGRCTWKVTVPNEIPKKGTATLTVVVRRNNKKDSTEVRSLTKEFDVKK